MVKKAPFFLYGQMPDGMDLDQAASSLVRTGVVLTSAKVANKTLGLPVTTGCAVDLAGHVAGGR